MKSSGRSAPTTTVSASEKARARRLKTLFDLTPDEYDQILEHQGGHCALCPSRQKPGGNRLAVDHDHKTGQVRGLLCWRCNTALGKFRDDSERLVAAANYVQHPPASTALGRDVFGRTGRVTKKTRRRKKK